MGADRVKPEYVTGLWLLLALAGALLIHYSGR